MRRDRVPPQSLYRPPSATSVQGKNGQRQCVMRQRDHYRRVAEDQKLQRLINQLERYQRGIQHAVGTEDDPPCIEFREVPTEQGQQ